MMPVSTVVDNTSTSQVSQREILQADLKKVEFDCCLPGDLDGELATQFDAKGLTPKTVNKIGRGAFFNPRAFLPFCSGDSVVLNYTGM